MSDLVEVLVTSDASGLLWNACMWDPRTGTALMHYKGGGTSAPHSLCLIGNDYLIAGEKSKPLLHVWPLNSQEIMQQTGHILSPGCVTALAISPDNCYCVAGVAEKLYIWQIASGRLMAINTRHFQTVTCIRFTDDGSHFISSGHDGMVLVWPLAYLVSQHTSHLFVESQAGQPDPRLIFSDHSLPVGDVFVGRGGMRARMVSVSTDRTCKVYDLNAGALLLSVVFHSSLTAVTMDPTESKVFVGAINGNINQFNLCNPPRIREHHLTKEEKAIEFLGHSNAVNCLSVSLDGLQLISASNDHKVMLWDIPSRQCVRVIEHKGPVSNAFFTIVPKQVFSSNFQPSVVLQSFKKSLEVSEDVPYIIEVLNKEKLKYMEYNGSEYFHTTMKAVEHEQSSLKGDIDSLKKINEELFKFAVEKILKY